MRQAPGRLGRILGRGFGYLLNLIGWRPQPLPLIDRYLYCSDFIRRISQVNCTGVARQEVIHWGLPGADRLPALPSNHFASPEPLALVFAGQLLDHKGLLVLVRALARCRRPHRLLVLGDYATDYAARCKRVAAKLGCAERIEFAGKKPHDEMLDLMSRAGHVLVVPSVWDEPFSIVVIEGMGIGLAVIASKTGGTAEAIADGENGLLFPRGDSKALTAAIDRLEADRDLARRIGAQARQTVRQRFTLEGMVDQILAGMVEAPGHASKPLAA